MKKVYLLVAVGMILSTQGHAETLHLTLSTKYPGIYISPSGQQCDFSDLKGNGPREYQIKLNPVDSISGLPDGIQKGEIEIADDGISNIRVKVTKISNRMDINFFLSPNPKDSNLGETQIGGVETTDMNLPLLTFYGPARQVKVGGSQQCVGRVQYSLTISSAILK